MAEEFKNFHWFEGKINCKIKGKNLKNEENTKWRRSDGRKS